MRLFLCGYAAGGLLLVLPWPWPPLRLLQIALALGLVALFTRLVMAFPGAGRADRRAQRQRTTRSFSRTSGAGWLVGLCGALLGFGWGAVVHDRVQGDRVVPGGTADAVRMVVRIVTDPESVQAGDPAIKAVRFQAALLEEQGSPERRPRRLRLSWYGAEPIRRGEVWRLAATLRPPWGYANPGGFDYERWLTGQRIEGVGTVRRGTRIAAATPGPIDRVRVWLGAFVVAQQLRYGPILAAQLVGVATDVPADQWEMFRATGTIHLMVISGLQIALAASLGFAIGGWAVRLCPPLLLWLDARKAGAWAGVICGITYLAIAGGGLPAVRACVMAAPMLLLLAWGRRCQGGSTLLVALAAILALDPLAVHQLGFWLSFGAVGILVVRFGRRYGREGRVLALVRAQWLLTVCMAPLLIVLTGALPLVALPANLIAVPVVSGAVVPLTLAGGMLAAIWPAAGGLCFWFADRLLVPLFWLLDWCRQVPQLHAEPPALMGAMALLGGLVWLFGQPRGYRLLPTLGLAAALLARGTGIDPGEFRVTGLDVGQGDGILVDTSGHRLLFDAGPAFPGGFETGSAVVVPSVLATGPGRLDVLVLSHEDLDHVGGAPAVERSLTIGRVYASFPRPGASPCSSRRWIWEGVTFRFLDVDRSGPGGVPPPSNERSCVLLVDNGRHRLLLAGDISGRIESRLLRALPGPVDVMFAPHHGSLGSSSKAFVRVARPRWVFVSAGRDNRYGHPHPRVVQRYREVGAAVLVTAQEGALAWDSRAPDEVRGCRGDGAPYWRGSAHASARD